MGMMNPMTMGMGMMSPMAMPMMNMMSMSSMNGISGMGGMGMMGMMPMMGIGGMGNLVPGMVSMPPGSCGAGHKDQEQAYESAMAVIRAGAAAGTSERERAFDSADDIGGSPVPRSNPLNPAYRPADSEPMPGVTDRRFEGKIRLFIEDQGYGFIKTEGLNNRFPDKDVFLHRNQKGRFVQGDIVSFTVFINFRGKPQATDLRRPRREDERESYD